MVLQKSGHSISAGLVGPATIATLPNMVTVLRLILVAVGVGAIAAGVRGALPALLCAVALALDCVDGWLARRLGQSSLVGELLDPIVDKLSVALLLIVIASTLESPLAWAVCGFIVARDVVVTAARLCLLSRGQRLVPDALAKAKTALVFLTCGTLVGFLFWFDLDRARVEFVALVSLSGMAVLTGVSGARYVGAIAQALTKRRIGEFS